MAELWARVRPPHTLFTSLMTEMGGEIQQCTVKTAYLETEFFSCRGMFQIRMLEKQLNTLKAKDFMTFKIDQPYFFLCCKPVIF